MLNFRFSAPKNVLRAVVSPALSLQIYTSLPARGDNILYKCLGADEGIPVVGIEFVHGLVCDVVLYIGV